jgi:hypothetical protein
VLRPTGHFILEDGSDVKFAIKAYNTDTQTTSSPFGNKISVFLKDTVLDEPMDEYVVDFETFVSLMQSHGYQLVQTNMFRELDTNPQMNEIQKTVSHLNRTFVFQKVHKTLHSNISDTITDTASETTTQSSSITDTISDSERRERTEQRDSEGSERTEQSDSERRERTEQSDSEGSERTEQSDSEGSERTEPKSLWNSNYTTYNGQYFDWMVLNTIIVKEDLKDTVMFQHDTIVKVPVGNSHEDVRLSGGVTLKGFVNTIHEVYKRVGPPRVSIFYDGLVHEGVDLYILQLSKS